MAQKVRSCGIITLGAVIYALAFDWFVAPNQIAMGGVTGLAQIVNALVPVLPVGVLSILVNVPLFLAGWRLLGGRLLVSSLYACIVILMFRNLTMRLRTEHSSSCLESRTACRPSR